MESPTVLLCPLAMPGIEKEQLPLVAVVVEQSARQLTPERFQEPFVQVAVAVPEYPAVLFVAEVLWVWGRPATEKLQDPLVRVALPQVLVVDVQLTPESVQLPLVQVAVPEPENPEALFVTGVF